MAPWPPGSRGRDGSQVPSRAAHGPTSYPAPAPQKPHHLPGPPRAGDQASTHGPGGLQDPFKALTLNTGTACRVALRTSVRTVRSCVCTESSALLPSAAPQEAAPLSEAYSLSFRAVRPLCEKQGVRACLGTGPWVGCCKVSTSPAQPVATGSWFQSPC